MGCAPPGSRRTPPPGSTAGNGRDRWRRPGPRGPRPRSRNRASPNNARSRNAQQADGTRRSRPEYFDGVKSHGDYIYGIGAFIGAPEQMTREQKAALVAAFPLVSQFGEAARKDYDNFYFFTPPHARLVMYGPDRPDRLMFYRHDAPANLDISSYDMTSLTYPANDPSRATRCTDPTNQKVVELILESVGVAPVIVENGAEALEALAAEPFDVVLMDMQMPELDGLSATAQLRELERKTGARRTPVIMLTANALDEHVRASLEAGADAHLSKPIRALSLIETMVRVMAAAQLEDAAAQRA